VAGLDTYCDGAPASGFIALFDGRGGFTPMNQVVDNGQGHRAPIGSGLSG